LVFESVLTPRAVAERDLLAPIDDVWGFIAEPRHLADWWPGIAAVEPDRRGLAPGGRWEVRRGQRPGLFRGARSTSTLLVREVDAPSRVAWHILDERLDVELELEATAPDRTLARLAVSGPLMLAFRRSLPRVALERLHALCQTAVTL
jgi:uncharacterized protein YndB with AHSA1/START domain